MHFAAFYPALLALIVAEPMRPEVLTTEEVTVLNAANDTLADAYAQARVPCVPPGSTCSERPVALREAVRPANECGAITPTLSWKSTADLRDGLAYAAEVQRYAATRQLFGCTGHNCLVVVGVTAKREHDQAVKTLAVCSVETIDGTPGPPTRCEEVLKRQPQQGMFLRVKMGLTSTQCSMGLRDFDAVFKGRAQEIVSVRNDVGGVLRARPFNLSVIEDQGALVGTRAQAASEVLPGWREWVTLRVELTVRGVDVGASIFSTMLVSKQASADREAWTPPSEPLEESYLLALRRKLEQRGAVLRSAAAP
jgi:hypothetical protein